MMIQADVKPKLSVATEKCGRQSTTAAPAPAAKGSICRGRRALSVSLSSKITSGTEAAAIPRKSELTAYMCVRYPVLRGYRFSLVLLVHGRDKAFDSGTQLRVADDKMYRRGFSLGYHCPLPLVDKYL